MFIYADILSEIPSGISSLFWHSGIPSGVSCPLIQAIHRLRHLEIWKFWEGLHGT